MAPRDPAFVGAESLVFNIVTCFDAVVNLDLQSFDTFYYRFTDISTCFF